MIRKLKKGFTLVELVVVIAVIAILAAVSVVSYLSITKKAKESHDQQIIDQINLSLSAEEAAGRKPETMHKALEVVEANGFAPERFNSNLYSGYDLAYHLKENKFVLLTKNTSTVVYPEGVSADVAHELWKFTSGVSDDDLNDGFSHYLTGEITGTVANISSGFDVGDYTGLESIKYTGDDSAKNAVIRTNAAGTTLAINAPNDTIDHYNLAGSVSVITGQSSYHEYGTAGYVEVLSGKVVAEQGGLINTVVLTGLNATESNPAVIFNNGGEFTNKYALTNALATSNNNVTGSVTLALRVGENAGDVLLTEAQETEFAALSTDEAKAIYVAEKITSIKAEAEAAVTPVTDEYLAMVASIENAPESAGKNYAIVRGENVDYGTGDFQSSSIEGEKGVTVIFLDDTTIKHQADDPYDDGTVYYTFIASTEVTFDANGHDITFEDGIILQLGLSQKSDIILRDSEFEQDQEHGGHFYCNYIYMYISDAHLYFTSGNFDYREGHGSPEIEGLSGMMGSSPLGQANVVKINGESTFNHDITSKGTPSGTGGYTWFDSSIFEVQALGGSRWALVSKA